MQGIKFIRCTIEDCGREFKVGEGHTVACCCGAKPICNECYERLKAKGYIKDRKFNKNEVANDLLEHGK